MLTFPGARHEALQLFGQVQNDWPGSRNSINMGVDLRQLRPITLDEIDEIDARGRAPPVNSLWDEDEPRRPLE